jgi:hypothetical protein
MKIFIFSSTSLTLPLFIHSVVRKNKKTDKKEMNPNIMTLLRRDGAVGHLHTGPTLSHAPNQHSQ